MARKNKKPRVPIWQWIVSISIVIISATIIWTNESMDLLNKIGFNFTPGQAIVIIFLIMTFSTTWVIISILRHKKLI